VDQIADALLHILIGRRLVLTDQQNCFVRKLGAAIYRSHHRIDEIITVQIGLPVGDVTGEEVGGRQAFEYAGDLLGDEGCPIAPRRAMISASVSALDWG
jgi:hypothetical protein